jgi:hypothetical protein
MILGKNLSALIILGLVAAMVFAVNMWETNLSKKERRSLPNHPSNQPRRLISKCAWCAALIHATLPA